MLGYENISHTVPKYLSMISLVDTTNYKENHLVDDLEE